MSDYLAKSTAPTTIEALVTQKTISDDARDDFRSYVTKEGLALPRGPDTDVVLSNALMNALAYAKFGAPGYYRISASHDPELARAVDAFARAAAILGK